MKHSGTFIKWILCGLLLLGTGVLTAGCGGEDDPSLNTGTNQVGGGNNSLVGVWELSTVNGQDIVPGVWLRWEFTATTVTVTSDWDCTEVIRYDASDGWLVGTEIISRTGTQCDPSDENPVLGPYTVSGDTLTVHFEDPEVTPSTAVFVFVRVG